MYEGEASHRIIGYGTLVLVWAGLLALTWLTVSLSGTHFGVFSLAAPFLIASVKAFLVIDYFMRLRYEGPFFKWIFLVALGTVAVVAWLVYEDVAYRY